MFLIDFEYKLHVSNFKYRIIYITYCIKCIRWINLQCQSKTHRLRKTNSKYKNNKPILKCHKSDLVIYSHIPLRIQTMKKKRQFYKLIQFYSEFLKSEKEDIHRHCKIKKYKNRPRINCLIISKKVIF